MFQQEAKAPYDWKADIQQQRRRRLNLAMGVWTGSKRLAIVGINILNSVYFAGYYVATNNGSLSCAVKGDLTQSGSATGNLGNFIFAIDMMALAIWLFIPFLQPPDADQNDGFQLRIWVASLLVFPVRLSFNLLFMLIDMLVWVAKKPEVLLCARGTGIVDFLVFVGILIIFITWALTAPYAIRDFWKSRNGERRQTRENLESSGADYRLMADDQPATRSGAGGPKSTRTQQQQSANYEPATYGPQGGTPNGYQQPYTPPASTRARDDELFGANTNNSNAQMASSPRSDSTTDPLTKLEQSMQGRTKKQQDRDTVDELMGDLLQRDGQGPNSMYDPAPGPAAKNAAGPNSKGPARPNRAPAPAPAPKSTGNSNAARDAAPQSRAAYQAPASTRNNDYQAPDPQPERFTQVLDQLSADVNDLKE